MDKVIIVMPAYNEAANIGLMIHELFDKIFPEIKDADMHLLVVDDFSPDGTGDIVKGLEPKYKNLHLLQKQREGLGWAYVRGFQYAMKKLNADAVMEMDADFQHPPRFVIPMVAAYLKGADYVIGSRYIPGGSVPESWAPFRKAVSYFGNLYTRLVLLNFKYHDMTTGFRLTRIKGVMDQIDLEHLMELKLFAHKMHLFYLTTKHAKKVVEVPLEFAARTKDVSKFNPKETFASLRVATILGIQDKQRFIKFGVVGFVGYLINAITLKILTGLNSPNLIAWSLPVELSIISNFILNNTWTFKSEEIKGFAAIAKKFLTFNGTSLGALLIQTIAGIVSDKLLGAGARQLTLPFIILVLILPFNYIMYNLVIWKTWKTPKLSNQKS